MVFLVMCMGFFFFFRVVEELFFFRIFDWRGVHECVVYFFCCLVDGFFCGFFAGVVSQYVFFDCGVFCWRCFCLLLVCFFISCSCVVGSFLIWCAVVYCERVYRGIICS